MEASHTIVAVTWPMAGNGLASAFVARDLISPITWACLDRLISVAETREIMANSDRISFDKGLPYD